MADQQCWCCACCGGLLVEFNAASPGLSAFARAEATDEDVEDVGAMNLEVKVEAWTAEELHEQLPRSQPCAIEDFRWPLKEGDRTVTAPEPGGWAGELLHAEKRAAMALFKWDVVLARPTKGGEEASEDETQQVGTSGAAGEAAGAGGHAQG